MPPTYVILNPWAGRGRGARVRPAVERALKASGRPFELAPTTGPGHAMGLARQAVAAGAERIVVAGGDGTLHEVANALLDLPAAADGGTPAAMGCIPLGTGNDYAKLLGVYRQPIEVATARTMHADTALFDAGQALGEYFDNIFGVGFDAETVRHGNRIRRLKGVAVYLAAIYRTFLTFKPPVLEIACDAHRETGAMMMLAANIGVCGGGSFYLTPQADPTDGLLDVCLIRKVGWGTFLTAVPRVMKGTHSTMDECAIFRTDKVTIRSTDGRPLLAQLDGELRETGSTEVEVTLVRRRLRVMVAR